MVIKNVIAIISICILTCWSCDDQHIVFSEKQNVSAEGWSYDDSLIFQLDIPDTSILYGLYLHIDHDEDFAYQNMYLNLSAHYPDESGSAGNISVQLQDEQARWQGDCSGPTCSLEIVIKDPVRFKKQGQYFIDISQASREPSLSGIRSVGLTLEKK